MILLAEHDEPSLAAKKKQRPVASEKTTSPSKNRVWNFFGRPLGRTCSEPDLSAENAIGSVQYSYETASGQGYYYTTDHLGSIREMCDGSGNIVARYQYDPSGVTTLVQGTNMATFQYARYYAHQVSGLQFAVFRGYDPNTDRWLNRDPIGENGGINLYEYVQDDPVLWKDRLGLQPAPQPPVYDPSYWNDPSRQPFNNCYNYACDLPSGDFKQPGGGYPNPTSIIDCASLKARVKADGATSPDSCGKCPQGTHKIRLWVNNLPAGAGGDFHFYRQDGDGTWSDKPGSTPAGPRPNPNNYAHIPYQGYQNCGDLCVKNQPPH